MRGHQQLPIEQLLALFSNNGSTAHDCTDKDYWEDYNTGLNDGLVSYRDEKGKNSPSPSYSHIFFGNAGINLNRFMNSDCRKILQLGASAGKFLGEYQQKGWSVMGYDYSASSITTMKSNKIPAKLIDLNKVSDTGKLDYATELKSDLVAPTNILLIRVLEYLDPAALEALLFFMIDNAKPNSVFVVAGFCDGKEGELPYTGRTPNYKPSFFGARTDMRIELLKRVGDDEICVVRKLDMGK